MSLSNPGSITRSEKPAIENGHADQAESADFEKAIKLCGYGRFHYGFVLLCGSMFLCAGFQNAINAYILPSAQCDLQLSSTEKGLLNVSFLVGGVMSSIVWGVLADAYGRRNVLLMTLFLDSIITVFSSFSQTFQVLLIFRMINGFTIGAPGALIYTYLGEFHCEKQRAKSICYVGFFWTLSWLILPGLAWIIIPLQIHTVFHGMVYNSWRLFLAIISIPTFIVTLVATGYPESPKFLVSQGRTKEALMVLRKIYAINTGKRQDEYPVKILLPDPGSSLSPKHETDRKSAPGVLAELLKNIWQQIRSITSPPLLKYAILCWTIYLTNMFGYFGLGLWLPELFNRFENHYKAYPNQTVSVCQLMYVQVPDDEQLSGDTISRAVNGTNCIGSIDQNVFSNTLIINFVCLFGNVLSGFLANRVGRRTMPVGTMLVAGSAGIAVYFLKSSLQNLIVSCIYSVAISTANFVVGSVVVDIFPTHVAAIAVCMMTCFGRIGAIASNLAFGMLLDISCEVPIFLVGGVVLFGGLLGFLLPLNKR